MKEQQVDAQEVIAELQSEIADKALQIALLKAQVKDLKDQAAENHDHQGGEQ